MLSILLVLAVAAGLSPWCARLGRWGGALLAIAPAYGAAWLVGWMVGGSPRAVGVVRYPWVEELGVQLAFRLDGLSGFFGVLVLGIGAFILAYAGSYLDAHRDLKRFYVTLLAFMASMVGLVFADDALLLFVFWEATSLTSYLLVGFHHEEESARVAARKALVVTGFGGLALLGGFILLHSMTGSWLVSEWTDPQGEMKAAILGHPLCLWAFVLVLLGAFTKSAQVPFHFWLPAAMAGPTPVSAFLHSATMVKAGVFLLARLSPLFGSLPEWFYALTAVGLATMVLSAWAALRFRDLKTVLAYTTTMALGLLVMLLGLGDSASVAAAMTYLLVHALYKGGLFMVAGVIDHGTGTRDLERLSGLFKKMPWTGLAAGLACASMAGLPPLLGFVAKESVYEAAIHFGPYGWFVLVVSWAANAALFGVSCVLFIKPFFGRPSEAAAHAHEGDLSLLAGPLVLGTLGFVLGIAPHLLDELVGAATSAVTASPAHPHLALWHGWTPALGASVLTYASGLVVFASAASLRSGASFGRLVQAFTDWPAQRFESTFLMAGVRVAAAVSRFVYSGHLRWYVFVTLISSLTGIGWVLVRSSSGLGVPSFGTLLPHEAVLLAVLVVSSGLAAFMEPAMKAIIAVGISGYCVALLYLLFGAPDVAMTQFAIETLTVILVVLTLLHLPRAGFQTMKRRAVIRDVGLSLGLGGLLSTLLLGVLARPLPSQVSEWYLRHSAPDAHGNNVVNVILVDFRGFDTWGEITVLTIAGLGVYALFRRQARHRSQTVPVTSGSLSGPPPGGGS